MVNRCRFIDNEMGLLTGNIADAELTVRDCEFGEAPRHSVALPHLLYAGSIARLTVTGSRFSGGRRGHLLKSRAREHHIRYNHLVDGEGAAHPTNSSFRMVAWPMWWATSSARARTPTTA